MSVRNLALLLLLASTTTHATDTPGTVKPHTEPTEPYAFEDFFQETTVKPQAKPQVRATVPLPPVKPAELKPAVAPQAKPVVLSKPEPAPAPTKTTQDTGNEWFDSAFREESTFDGKPASPGTMKPVPEPKIATPKPEPVPTPAVPEPTPKPVDRVIPLTRGSVTPATPVTPKVAAPKAPVKPLAHPISRPLAPAAATPAQPLPHPVSQPVPPSPATRITVNPAPPAVPLPLPRPEDAPQAPVELFAAGNYRLRTGPYARIQLVIPKGSKFEVLGRKGDWYIVRYRGRQGYVHKDGITHPLVEALKERKEFDLAEWGQAEVAEVAACLESSGDREVGTVRDLIQSLESKLSEVSQPGLVADAALPATPPLPVARPAHMPPALTVTGTKPIPTAPPRRAPARATEDLNCTGQGRQNRACVLRDNIRAAAKKYRAYAPHVCRRFGRPVPCGGSSNPHRSKGWCKQGVREAIEKTLGYSIPGGSATESREFLASKLTKVNVSSCKDAPIGAVCVYRAKHHRWGHIEIRADKNEFCSDYCAANPVGTRSHELVGVYYP